MLAKVLFQYIELINRFYRTTFEIAATNKGISIRVIGPGSAGLSIDERIAKLDAAREYFHEGIKAIDELRLSAEDNKKELEESLKKIKYLETQKVSAQEELAALKQIMSADVEAFRKLAGIASPAQIRRERFVGFIAGVFASLIASALWWGGGQILPLVL